jgi:hypothetical protein
MADQKLTKYYRDITLGENRARLRSLIEFRQLVIKYFDNSTLNMISGSYIEKEEAREARNAINLKMNSIYQVIRLANINPSAASAPLHAAGGQGKNIDLIRNIFNLGRNNIPAHAAIDYVERAIDVYKSNRLDSFIRTINPFYWMKTVLHFFSGSLNKKKEKLPKP